MSRLLTAVRGAMTSRHTFEPDRVLRRPRTRSAVAPLAWTTVSGLAYALAFPPVALRPVAWVALVPFLLALEKVGAGAAMLLGCVWAFVMTFATSTCLPRAVQNYYGQSALVGWGMLFGATVVTMVPYYSAFAVAYWRLARRFRAALPLLAAAAWTGAELLRVKVLGGNPWAVSGYTQIGWLPLMQIAELTGVHGMSFLVVAVNATLVQLWHARTAPASERRSTLRGAAIVASLLAAVLLYGRVRLSYLSAEDEHVPGVTVAIVQGNLDLGAGWRSDMYGKNLRDYLRLTSDAVREADPALVFWPESAMTFFLADEPAYRSSIARVLRSTGVQLVAGGPRAGERSSQQGEPELFNSTFLVESDGRVAAWQDKTKLLPFAEYFPLQSVDLLRRDFGRARQFTPGAPREPLPTVAGKAGAIVCNEAMYPEPAAERVRAGAQLLVSPSNDSWFDDLQYSLQAFDIVRLRTVEQRRDMVRTSTAGPSATIDATGRVTARTEPFVQTWVAGRVRPRDARTPYSVAGDVFAGACLAVALLACALPSVRAGD